MGDRGVPTVIFRKEFFYLWKVLVSSALRRLRKLTYFHLIQDGFQLFEFDSERDMTGTRADG